MAISVMAISFNWRNVVAVLAAVMLVVCAVKGCRETSCRESEPTQVLWPSSVTENVLAEHSVLVRSQK